MTKRRIQQFYDHFDGNVYVSFSGGKDSTVLLDIVRQVAPEVKAVFSDTGLEYPDIRDFVKTVDNVVWVKPRKNFKQVIQEYGYPVISKTVSQLIYDFRAGKDYAKKTINGLNSDGERSFFREDRYLRWEYLINAPFKMSDKCCEFIKEEPLDQYEKQTGEKPIMGLLAEESRRRTDSWRRTGCNAYEGRQKSIPMAFWKNQDVLQYLKETGIPYCKLYGDIVTDPKTGKLTTTGHKRTGCMFCGYGAHLEKRPNRYEMLKKEYPKLYEYIMKPIDQHGLGFDEVLSWLGIPH